MLYVLLIVWISHTWQKAPEYVPPQKATTTLVSILIPFKNEKEHLQNLLYSLASQGPLGIKSEIIFINDHSTDGGEKILKNYPNYTLLQNRGEGKKAALTTGIEKASGELIITLDADCVVPSTYLHTLVSYYEEHQPGLLICPVQIKPGHLLFDKIQALEFQSLAVTTGGTALARKAVMCNGASLAFKRSLIDSSDVWRTEYKSGDDMFLLEHAKRIGAKVDFLKSQQALVMTSPIGWKAFWKQRMRWTSKAGGYHDIDIIAIGAIVLFANVMLLVLPFISLPLLILAFLLKLGADHVLLKQSAKFFKTRKVQHLIYILAPFYPLYVLISLVGGRVVKSW